ncbi:BAG family molecular chaperone regulator 5, mitochondrial-like [Trifolium pratense]|uniref:BAG family molecular chaperone regulator 5, mitochondrial-like n=1 Tax=Trifolium pratense TaxID=57577 RepID=UPI001E6971B9|nr:BAG family molecular chaperone regulator 5, mitochondrial-like [Trifolium pratense]
MMQFNNNKRTPATPLSLYGNQCNYPRYNKTPSKVVSIPVRFVGSERNRADSATKIQKVARGFLVRKNLKKMLKIKVELEEIENKVNNEETVKMMKKEQKEKIRIGETIMNLLLRLDSVRIFNCCYALRDLRKLLIKRAIVLQEFVDQIQMMTIKVEDENGEGKCDGVEEICLEKEEVGSEEENEGGKKIEALVNSMEKEDGGCDEKIEGGEKMDSLVNEEKDVVGGEGKYVKEEENCLIEEKEDEDEEKMEVEEEKEESVGTSLVEEEGIEVDSVVVKEEEGKIGIECEEVDGNRKMLKRMMEDNEKMMDMMAQLFERNEKQTSLLTSLTQRVEQLEKAFICDKLSKKNKRRNVDAKHRCYNGYI